MLFILIMGCPPYTSPDDPAFIFLCGSDGGDAKLDSMIDAYSRSMGWEGPSALARDLLRGMLAVDPRQRLCLDDVLSHPWMAEVVGRFSICWQAGPAIVDSTPPAKPTLRLAPWPGAAVEAC